MASTIREVLPRQELRRLDRTPGRYPTIARTGGSRKGNNPVYFDDTTVVVFHQTSSIVSYPTTLPVGSRYLSSDMTSSLSSSRSGTVNSSAVNSWIVLPQQVESLTPFIENRLFEQDFVSSSSFALTGSDPAVVGLGFSSGLFAKTKIRLTLPIGTTTTLSAQTASLLYYNMTTQKFEQIGELEPGIGNGRAIFSYPWDGSNKSSIDIFTDAKLFGAFGNNIISGSVLSATLPFAQATPQGSGRAKHVKEGAVNAGIQIFEPNSPTLSSVYAASGGQLLTMSNYINRPFLLEKMILEVPIRAGAGWSFDQTRTKKLAYPNASPNFIFDAGGPAITMGLLNQFSTTNRDIIITGTFIPQNDNTSYARQETHPQIGIAYRYAWGFLSYATPAGVVPHDSNGVFSGSVRLNMQAAVSNGVSSYSDNGSNYNGTFADTYVVSVNPIGRNMSTLPSGRSYFGKEFVMPQNYSLTSINVNKFGATPGGVLDSDFYSYEQSMQSPYLLMPSDKLVLFASKHRPVASATLSSTSNNPALGPFALTGAHDIAFNPGTIYVTLYGSLISDTSEFHDTLNQRLETNEIHEMIGTDPVLDDTNVEYMSQFSGSFLSSQLTGTLYTMTTGTFALSNRLVWAESAITTSYKQTLEVLEPTLTIGDYANYSDLNTFKKERFSFQRFCQPVSSNERYFDTLVPNLDDVFTADGTYLTAIQYVFGGGAPIGNPIVYATFDCLPASIDTTGGIEVVTSNNEWTKSFPFEPKYRSARRILNAEDITCRNVFVYTSDLSIIPSPSRAEFKATKFLTRFTSQYLWMGETPNFFSVTNQNLRIDTKTKLVYGFGDLNTYPNQAMYTLISSSAGCNQVAVSSNIRNYGCTNSPQSRAIVNNAGGNAGDVSTLSGVLGSTVAGEGFNLKACPRGNHQRGAVIRGWKYGLINGFPQFTKAIFDTKNFGQPRNMLEQRKDTKFFETVGYKADGTLGGNIGTLLGPVQIKFVNYRGELADPATTWSSNLSFEATSSLPYFDGDVRNREEPIDVSTLELTLVSQ